MKSYGRLNDHTVHAIENDRSNLSKVLRWLIPQYSLLRSKVSIFFDNIEGARINDRINSEINCFQSNEKLVFVCGFTGNDRRDRNILETHVAFQLDSLGGNNLVKSSSKRFPSARKHNEHKRRIIMLGSRLLARALPKITGLPNNSIKQDLDFLADRLKRDGSFASRELGAEKDVSSIVALLQVTKNCIKIASPSGLKNLSDAQAMATVAYLIHDVAGFNIGITDDETVRARLRRAMTRHNLSGRMFDSLIEKYIPSQGIAPELLERYCNALDAKIAGAKAMPRPDDEFEEIIRDLEQV